MDKNEEQDLKTKNQDILELETLAFHFTQLSKRLSQDREHWAETGKNLSKIVKGLEPMIQRLANLEPRLKERVTVVLEQESREAIKMIAQTLRATTQQVLIEQITTTANTLSRVVDEVSSTLRHHQREVNILKKRFLAGIIFSALVASILTSIGVYCLLPFMDKQEMIQVLQAVIDDSKGRSSSYPSQLKKR